MAKVLTFEDGKKEFPRGPMYWINNGNKEVRDKGFEMRAVAVGSEGGKQRSEKICKISTQYPATATEMNSHAEPVLARKELLTAPTETDLPSTIHKEALLSQTEPAKASDDAEVNGAPIVQEGKLIPASRPEPVTFVTATEGVDTLNEKIGNLALNGNGPHQTRTANLLDPNLATNGDVAMENAHQHHSAGNGTDPAVGGGVEEADAAHMSANYRAGRLVEEVKEKVRITA
jgi:hypothetical protein